MKVNQCPKCNAECKLSEANVHLGTLVECAACGCRFEFIGERPNASASSRFRAPFEPVLPNKQTVRPSPPKTKSKIAWKGFLILLVGWSVLSLIFRVTNITFLFPANLILMAFCRMNRTTYKKANSKTFAYFLFDRGVEVFLSLTIVVGFYLVASWLFDGSSDQSTLGYLWQLEDRFMYFKNFLARYLIFKPWISAILIAILITVDLVYVAEVGFEPSGEGTDKEKQKSLVSRYLTFQKVIRRVYVVLVLLCSFTFFGNALLGQKIARVQVRITKIRSGYEQVEKATEAALTAAVQQRLLDEIDNSIAFTRPYLAQPLAHPHRYYHDIIYTSHDRIESLRKSYSTAKSTAAVNLGPNLDARVNEVTSKPPPAYDGPREVPYSDIARGTDGVTETPSQVETHPANLKELTSGKLTEINKALQDTSKVRKSVSAIKLADGTEILIQLPKSFTNVAKGAAFRTLIARFPFLEPIIDALVSAFDKTVEQRIKAKVGPKLDSLLARWFPGETLSQADFQYEAGTIVNESNVTVSETVIKDTKAAAHEYTESIADSDQLIKEVDNRIETARVHNEPPPETVLSSGDTLPEATCAKSALDNYRTRLQRAKTSGERMEAAIKYESDLARLREREFLPGFKPG